MWEFCSQYIEAIDLLNIDNLRSLVISGGRLKKINFVQDTFEGNIFEIMNKLKNSNIDFANKIFENL